MSTRLLASQGQGLPLQDCAARSTRRGPADCEEPAAAAVTAEWEPLPPLLQPRVAGTAQSVGGLLVVTGGQGVDGNLVLTTEVFDGTAWTEVAPLPVPREHLASATDGTYMYVVGGRVLSSDANLPDLERYDPATNTWAEAAPMATSWACCAGMCARNAARFPRAFSAVRALTSPPTDAAPIVHAA